MPRSLKRSMMILWRSWMPRPIDAERWRVTVIGYDYLGEFSLICGLMFVYGMDIIDSHVFTYEPSAAVEVNSAR